MGCGRTLGFGVGAVEILEATQLIQSAIAPWFIRRLLRQTAMCCCCILLFVSASSILFSIASLERSTESRTRIMFFVFSLWSLWSLTSEFCTIDSNKSLLLPILVPK